MSRPLDQKVYAEIILEGFENYMSQFREFTKLAPELFSDRNWSETQKNHRERLRVYKNVLLELADALKKQMGDDASSRTSWALIKNEYHQLIQNKLDGELAETFFNSVIRKTFPELTLDEDLMYVREANSADKLAYHKELLNSYPASIPLEEIIRQILDDYDFGAPFLDKETDVRNLVRSVKRVILSRYEVLENTKTEILKSVFYRNKAAYLIGRTYLGHKWMPFIIPFMNCEEGVFVDTLIFDPDMMSHLFSFTRSYFMVDAPIPSEVISFLHAVIPHKKVHELYNAIGFNKHGKTLLYRDLLYHLESSSDQFEIAPGVKGMVMTVFTLPSLNLVFKSIKDHFEPPKSMTRNEVRGKYKLVSLHDRVGRMADTHEFEGFKIPLNRVSDSLLKELRNTINSLIRIENNHLIIKHLYTERKMIPLNVHLDQCSAEEGKAVVEDYGRAILQLAQANIFPGDMLTKNFGLTRQNRVVFYDYDEIEFLVDMNFRIKPKAETYEQIYASRPWYHIAPNDVFPEDFRRWMIGREDLKEHFISYHKNLFDPEYWQDMQKQIRRGEWIHAYPYPEEIRFRPSLSV